MKGETAFDFIQHVQSEESTVTISKIRIVRSFTKEKKIAICHHAQALKDPKLKDSINNENINFKKISLNELEIQ